MLVVLAALGTTVPAVGPAAGQSDTVTVTVVVETLDGDPVGNAAVRASWDGDSDRKTTAGNGGVFVDVPSGETVTYEVEHPDYVRNRPFRASRTSESEVTVLVSPTASLTVVATNDAGDTIEGATVLLDGESVGETDASGQLAVRIDERGEHELRARRNALTSPP